MKKYQIELDEVLVLQYRMEALSKGVSFRGISDLLTHALLQKPEPIELEPLVLTRENPVVATEKKSSFRPKQFIPKPYVEPVIDYEQIVKDEALQIEKAPKSVIAVHDQVEFDPEKGEIVIEPLPFTGE